MADPILKTLLAERGLSNNALARALGCQPSVVSYWMNGRDGRPTQRKVPAIVAALELDAAAEAALSDDVTAYEQSRDVAA